MSGTKSQGYVSVWRGVQDHWLWEEKPFSKGQAWIDLLLLANHADHKLAYKGQIILCRRGEVNRSVSSLATRWGWGRHKTRDFLKLLEADGMITVNATTNRTTITVANYSIYQDARPTNRPANRPTSGQRADTYNNENNDNNDDLSVYPRDNDTPWDIGLTPDQIDRLTDEFMDVAQLIATVTDRIRARDSGEQIRNPFQYVRKAAIEMGWPTVREAAAKQARLEEGREEQHRAEKALEAEADPELSEADREKLAEDFKRRFGVDLGKLEKGR